MGNKLGTFLLGGLTGAVIALLYAPRSGKETRAIVTERVNEAWGEAQEIGSQAAGNVQQAYQGAAANAQDFYGVATARVHEAADNIKPVFTQKNDELREKIESARQRIASQVVKNMEESQEVAEDAIPVVAEVEEAASEEAIASEENSEK